MAENANTEQKVMIDSMILNLTRQGRECVLRILSLSTTHSAMTLLDWYYAVLVLRRKSGCHGNALVVRVLNTKQARAKCRAANRDWSTCYIFTNGMTGVADGGNLALLLQIKDCILHMGVYAPTPS